MFIIDERFLAKRFKSNNRAVCRPEHILHIIEQFVGFQVPDTSTIDNLFHSFTDPTCQGNMATISRIRCLFTRLWNRYNNYFPPIT